MNDKLTKLFEGAELSDELKTGLAEAFEQAVSDQMSEATIELDEKYKTITEEYCEYLVSEYEQVTNEYIQEEVVPTISKYVDFAATEFMNENKIAVESGIKVELAESFLKGITQLSEQFNVKVPEQDIADQIKSLEEKVEKANKKLDKTLTEKSKLEEQIVQNKKDKIIESVKGDLAKSQVEKLTEGLSKVSYIDDEQYTNAVTELKESYFPEGSDKSVTDKKEKLDESTDKVSWLDQYISKI